MEKEELRRKIKELPKEQREELLKEMQEESREPPRAGWCTEPLKFKIAVKHLEGGQEASRAALRDRLNENDELNDINSENFGLVGRESNTIFKVQKSDKKISDRISLTEQGEEIAEHFDDNFGGLSPVEKTIFRGLHQYGAQYVFLAELEKQRQKDGAPDGVLRNDLEDKLEEEFGGTGRFFMGYYAALFSRLELVKKTQDGRQVRYELNVPSSW